MDCTDLRFDLGDARLNKTASTLCDKVIDKKSAVINQLADNPAEKKKLHRFINNERVNPERIVLPIIHKTSDICSKRNHVLLIQDTTEFAFEAANKGTRTDVGLVGHDKSIGFRAHVNLALDASTSQCLGLAGVEILRKTGKSELTGYERNSKKIEEKTSYRWLSALIESTGMIDKSTRKTFVGDRESDMFEFINAAHQYDCDFVIRSSADRNTSTQKEAKILYLPRRQRVIQYHSLTELLSKEKVYLEYEDLIPRISGVRKERRGHFEVRFIETMIRRTSRKGYSKDTPRDLPVTCIEIKEITDNVSSPIYWRLLTSHKINCVEDCKKIIHFYKARWNIEQLFRLTKKKGLKVEENQGKKYETLANIAAFALISACHCFQLMQARDIDSKNEPPAENLFDKESMPILDFLNKKYQGKTKKQKNLAPHGSLRWACWIIARMGGWCGYISQGKPGPITIKNGLEQFAFFEQGWFAAKML